MLIGKCSPLNGSSYLSGLLPCVQCHKTINALSALLNINFFLVLLNCVARTSLIFLTKEIKLQTDRDIACENDLS